MHLHQHRWTSASGVKKLRFFLTFLMTFTFRHFISDIECYIFEDVLSILTEDISFCQIIKFYWPNNRHIHGCWNYRIHIRGWGKTDIRYSTIQNSVREELNGTSITYTCFCSTFWILGFLLKASIAIVGISLFQNW